MVQSQTFRTPSLPRLDIRPDLNEAGELEHRAVPQSELIAQPKTGALNLQRISEKDQGGSTHQLAYRAVCGEWVVELRNPNLQAENTIADLNNLTIPRLNELQLEGTIGESTHLRLTDFQSGRAFNGLRAELAENNIVLSAQSINNLHGFHAERGADGNLKGFYPEQSKIEALLARKLGHEVHTKPPEDDSIDVASGQAFRSRMTHGMAIAELSDGKWHPTDIIPAGRIAINFANATAVQYAQAGFEGIAGCYDGAGNIVILNLEKNAERLRRTCLSLGLPELSVKQIIEGIIETVSQNSPYIPRDQNGKLYIRPYVAGLEGGSGASSATRAIFAVQVWPYGDYVGSGDKPVYLEGLLNVHRPDSGYNKVSANYAPSFGIRAQSRERGPKEDQTSRYRDIVNFDRAGNIEELSTANPFFIERTSNGKLGLITPPTSLEEAPGRTQPHILPSITRDTVIQIAKKLGIEVQIEDLNAETFKDSSRNIVGMFATGTAVGLQYITGLDLKTDQGDTAPLELRFNNEEAKALAKALYNHLATARTGRFEGPLAGLENDISVTRIPIK